MSTTYLEQRGRFGNLAARISGTVLLPNNEGFEATRQLWNGRVTTQPAAIVRCTSVPDVIETVRFARTQRLPLSVRGAGHDFAGRALCEGGVVVDCSLMRAVTIDPDRRTARVQGGATAGDLITAAHPYGLATTTGTNSTVGLAGFTLGGGYGALMGAYGLGADNLLAAEVVTADGQLITVNAEEHPELLWGLRGGGGNFGVVVTLKYRLHALTTVVSGLLLFPIEQARELLQGFDAFTATAPDTLTVQSGFLSAPDSSPMVYLTPTYCGPLEESEAALAPLRALGTPLADQVQPMSYHAFQHALDAYVPKGRHYYIQTRSLGALTPTVIDTLIEQGLPLTSPFSIISLHNFHGAASRVDRAATAFALRQQHFMVELIAGWNPSAADDGQRHIEWARHLSQALAPFAIEGGYVNLLDADEQPRVPLAFGPNYERLCALKRTYDPEDVFNSTVGHLTS